MASMPGIVIQIGAQTKDAIDGINRVNGALGDSLGGMDKFKAGVDKAFVPAVAVIGALGVAAVDFGKAAAEDAKAAGIFANALKNTTGATADQITATEDWITAQGKLLGIADDQLRPAIQKLAAASGDLGQAQKDAALAMDIAAQAGVPVETAANAIAKAYDGSFGALKKLMPGLDEAALKNKDLAAVMAELQGKTAGAAQVVADSAEGSFARFNLAIGEAKEGIGAALLPVLDAIMPKVLAFAQWAQDNTDTLLKIAGAVGILAGGIVVLKGILEAVAVAQAALNLVMSLNPIGIVVLAIAALVAALVYLYHNNETVKNAIDAAWKFIQAAVAGFVTWFQTTAWPAIQLVFGYLKTGAQALWDKMKIVWDGVKFAADLVIKWFTDVLWPAFQAVFALLTGDWDAFGTHIRNLWNGLVSFFGGLIGKFADIGGNIIDAIKRGISNAWGAFTGWLSGIMGDLIRSVLSVFGISSPSKVFMGIGQDIVAGWSAGLAGMTSVNAGVLAGANGLVNGLPTVDTATTTSASTGTGVGMLSDEQLARALYALLARSDLRNGRMVPAV